MDQICCGNFLFHGDTVIFIHDPYRSLNDNMRFFIGIRRAICSRTKLSYLFPSQNEEEESEGEEGCYTRRTLCRVSQKSVKEAERLAVAGQPFMATFYPNSGLSEFVVAKETVDASLAVKWALGMRVRMTMVDAETSSSRKWPTYYGTVSFTGSLQENGQSTCSGWARWQSLEIERDDPEMINYRKVGAWHVEPIVTTTLPYNIKKRMKQEEGTSHAGLHCNGSSSTAICEHESQKISNSCDSDSPTSDIMSKAAVGSQKTFKLFGKIIQIKVVIQ